MNEDQKNIETCLPENILAEVANCPTDAQFRSLVEESFDPLQQQAVEQAGWDAYKEVVDQHKPYTFTSQVAQMKSNLILLLRRLWRFPFGSGASLSDADTTPSLADAGTSPSLADAGSLRSLADMWQHYISRLQGNETYGIPSRLDQLTDLPSAPLLVSDRKISGADVPDGMSLIHLMTDTSEVTELTDDNRDWNLTSVKFGLFPNATKIQAWFKDAVMDWGYYVSNVYILNSAVCTEFDMRYFEEAKITGGNVAATYLFRDMAALTQFNLDRLRKITGGLFYNCDALPEVVLPSLKEVGTGVVIGCDNVERVVADELERVNGYANVPALIANNPKLKYASFPKLNYWYIYGAGTGGGSLMNMPLLEELIIGKAPFTSSSQFYRHVLEGCESLIKLDLRGDLNQNIYLDGWSPTLDSSNLQQFLQNFREFIAKKLTDNGSSSTKLTLTLSAKVYSAVMTDADILAVIVARNWKLTDGTNNYY